MNYFEVDSLQYLAKVSDLDTGIALTIVGMGVVFTVLCMIMVMLFSLQKAFAQKPKPEPVEKGTETSKTTQPDNETSPELMAVIAAAVAVAVKRPHTIRRVNLISNEVSHSWKGHGREKLHSSHRPKG